MKRLLALLLLSLSAFAQDVIPAGTDRSYTTVYTYDWTSDGSGNATGRVAVEVPGIIQSIATMPGTGADQPTDNYDVVVEQAFTNTAGTTTSQNVDLLAGVGANRDDTNLELVDIWPSPITNIRGKLQIEVTNAGAANKGRVQVFVYRTLAINSSGGNFGVPLGGLTRQILQWISSSQAKWVTVSGDATIADGGALTIANGAVTPAKTSITGTPNGLKYLRDDWTWQVPGGGGGVGDVSGPGLSTDNAIALWDGTDGNTLQNSNITYSGTALTVPADILITGGNGLAQQSGTQEWYKSTGVSAGNLRYRWIFNTDTESSTYTGSNLQLLAYDNTGDGSAHTAWELPRDPAAAWVFYHPITIDKLLTTKASATGGAGFNLPPGTAPTSPVNGDVWTTTAGLYARINGATVGPLGAGGATDHGALTGLSDDDHPQYGDLSQAETIAGNWVNTANPWADNEVADDITIATTSNLSAVANNTFGNASTDTHTFTGIAGFYGNTPDSDWAAGFARSVRIYKGTAYDYTASTTDLLITNSAADSRFIVGQDLTNYSTYTWTYNATAGSASSRLSNNSNQTMYIGKDASSPISFTGTTDHDGAANFDAGVTIGDAVSDTLHINPSSITLEGDAADANEITITTAALGADYTQTLPAKTGTFAMTSDLTAGQIVNTNITSVGNVGAGEDDLMTYPVTAGKLATNKDSLYFEKQFGVSNGVAGTRIRIYFGATVIFDTGAFTPSADGNIIVTGRIWRYTSTTQGSRCQYQSSITVGTAAAVQVAAPGETLSGAITLKATGVGVTNNDTEQYDVFVRYDQTP